MFDMVNKCYELRDVFESLCNLDEFNNRLNDVRLNDENWREFKSVIDFLEVMEKYTSAASGQTYATLYMQSLIYDSLVSHCNDTINGTTQSGFKTLACKAAAKCVLEKIRKYESYLCSPLTRLAEILDPRIGNGSDAALEMKESIRDTLRQRYDLNSTQPADAAAEDMPFDIFSAARKVSHDSISQITADEVDNYFEMTKHPDTTCRDAVMWWRTAGKTRFPALSMLSRDTLMIMGSSVPSESAFSDSDHFVTSDRASVTDENTSKMMKLRSWKRLCADFTN
jgi:hAT family C-terminal dimerisation region